MKKAVALLLTVFLLAEVSFSQEKVCVIVSEEELDEIVSGFAPTPEGKNGDHDIILWDEAKVNGSSKTFEINGVKYLKFEASETNP